MVDRVEMKDVYGLGLTWNYDTDTLCLKQSKDFLDPDTPLTKRNLRQLQLCFILWEYFLQ